MKKALLFAGFAALALCASAQNPFAYGIRTTGVSNGVATGKTITVNYTLNADAESGAIKFYKAGKTAVKAVDLAGDQLTKALMQWKCQLTTCKQMPHTASQSPQLVQKSMQ